MLTARLSGIERFVVVRSMTTDDAAVRLQSEPILQGLLADRADVMLHTTGPAAPIVIDRPTCLLFHYADVPAIEVIRSRPSSSEPVIVICISCDVYSYKPYIDLHPLVDFYLAPTELHRKVLSSQLYKPVYTLPECVDPIALGAPGLRRRAEPGRRLLWFGYSESFMKSMASLMPIVMDHRRLGTIESFALIVDKGNLLDKHGNPFDLHLIDYNAADFLQQTQEFDYAILSHFALDLTINSYIKSPNKAVTSLVAGLVPICSDTPNYKAVLDDYGLGRFQFSSPAELDFLLRHLDPASDAAAVQRSGAAEHLLQNYSGKQIYERFLTILSEHLRGERYGYEALQPEPLPPERARLLRLKEHLQDLVPSAIRSVEERFNRKTRV